MKNKIPIIEAIIFMETKSVTIHSNTFRKTVQWLLVQIVVKVVQCHSSTQCETNKNAYSCYEYYDPSAYCL